MASFQLPPPMPGDQGPGVIAACVTVAALATIGVCLRFIARRIGGTRYGADDYLILAALPFGWGIAVATIIAVKNGLGKHIGNLTPQELIAEGQAWYSTELIWGASIPFIKISILLLYVRIFGRQRYFRYTAYGFGVFSVCWSVMVVLVCALQCQPVQYVWDKSIEGTCINALEFFVVGTSLNVATDFAILLLPLPALIKLQMSVWHKISVVGIFLLGSLTCVFSLVRLVIIIQQYTSFELDVTWSGAPVAIWSTAEPCLGILAACLPTLRPLFFRAARRTNASAGSRSTGPDNSLKGNNYRLGIVSSGAMGGSRSLASNFSSRGNMDDLQRLRDGDDLENSDGGVSTECNSENRLANKNVKVGAIEVETTWSRQVGRR